MLYQPISPDANDAIEWAERGQFWIESGHNGLAKTKQRKRNVKPLILCGHGVSLRIENGTLVIRDGFTHYPQQQAKYRFFRGDLELPPRILLLDGSGTLSFDVLSWLGEQGVPLVRIEWTGAVAVVAGNSGYAADGDKLHWQNTLRDDEAKRLAFSAELIASKLVNSIETLRQHFPPSPMVAAALVRMREGIDQLAMPLTDIQDIRAIEGQCAAAYFSAWRGLEINWKATARHPIPDDWRRYEFRTSITTAAKPENRNASHPVNAMLNYAYAVRSSQLQIDAIAQGYDPTLGIMHLGRRGKPAYVFDMIEPERPKVDAAILAFINRHTFSGADFLIRPDGVCRLSPQLARVIATLVGVGNIYM